MKSVLRSGSSDSIIRVAEWLTREFDDPGSPFRRPLVKLATELHAQVVGDDG